MQTEILLIIVVSLVVVLCCCCCFVFLGLWLSREKVAAFLGLHSRKVIPSMDEEVGITNTNSSGDLRQLTKSSLKYRSTNSSRLPHDENSDDAEIAPEKARRADSQHTTPPSPISDMPGVLTRKLSERKRLSGSKKLQSGDSMSWETNSSENDSSDDSPIAAKIKAKKANRNTQPQHQPPPDKKPIVTIKKERLIAPLVPFLDKFPVVDRYSSMISEEMRRLSDDETNEMSSCEVDPTLIMLSEVVGVGSFAEVWRGDMRLASNGTKSDARNTPSRIEVAVKVSKSVDPKTFGRFRQELHLLNGLSHPNIVKCMGGFWSTGTLVLIAEFVPTGTLASFLDNPPFPLSWKHPLLNMAVGTAQGMAYLHQTQYLDLISGTMQTCIIHRDLKPQNLLVTADYNIKITDFGEARARDRELTMTQVGTLLYIAPEIVRGDKYDERVDVYSFGIVLLAMMRLKATLFGAFAEAVLLYKRDSGTYVGDPVTDPKVWLDNIQHMSAHAVTSAVVNNDIRPIIPSDVVVESFAMLVEGCWDPNPANRPEFNEIIDYLTSYVKSDILEDEEARGMDEHQLSVTDDGDGEEYEISTEESLTIKSAFASIESPRGGDSNSKTTGAADALRVQTSLSLSPQSDDSANNSTFPNNNITNKKKDTPIVKHSKGSLIYSMRGQKRSQDFKPTKGGIAIDQILDRNPALKKELQEKAMLNNTDGDAVRIGNTIMPVLGVISENEDDFDDDDDDFSR